MLELIPQVRKSIAGQRFAGITLFSRLSPLARQAEGEVTTRVASIESFRVLAIFMVILCHTPFQRNLSRVADGNSLIILTGYLVWWVGVPYFFITAGYFFQQSVLTHANPIAQFRRYVAPLAWILFAWMGIYVITPNNWPAEIFHHGLWEPFYTEAFKNVNLLTTQHIWLFIEGRRPVWHLWFIPALMFGLAILTLMAICQLRKYLVYVIITFYVLILAEESTVNNLLNSPVPLRQWIIAVPLVALGGWLAGREQPSATVAWGLIIGGYALALVEGTAMNVIFHSSQQTIGGHAFLGGIVLSMGMFLLALAKPKLGQSTIFPFLGHFTLGVYVSHIFVIYTISPFFFKLPNQVPLWGVFFAIIVYVVAVLTTLVVTRVPIVKFLVTKPVWRQQ